MVSFIKLLAKRTSGHRIAFSGGGVLGQNAFAKPEAIKSEPSTSNPSIGQASRQGVVSSKGQRIPRRSHMVDVSSYRFKFNFDHFFLLELDTTITLMESSCSGPENFG